VLSKVCIQQVWVTDFFFFFFFASVLEKIPKNQLQVRLHIGFKDVSKTLMVDANETASAFIANIFPKNKLNLPEDSKPEDYLLKINGQSDYLMGQVKMIDFKYVRRCIVKEEKIVLSLIPIASVMPKDDIVQKEEVSILIPH